MGAMAESIKGVSFILSFINLALTITCIALPDWRVNDVEGEVVELIERTQGLWTKCVFFPTGNWQCEDYDRFFIALPSAIIGARIFACLALTFQVVVVIALPFGMSCTRFPYGDEIKVSTTKAKISIACGLLSVVASLCIGIAVSWYAALVVEEYNINGGGMSNSMGNSAINTSMQRYVYGKALYIGWIAMAVLLIQGGVLCCSSWGTHEDKGYKSTARYDTQYNQFEATNYGGNYSGNNSRVNAQNGGQHGGHHGGGGQNYI